MDHDPRQGASEGHAGHGHGEPYVWDPEGERRRRGRRFLWIGLALVAVGTLIVWLSSAAAGG